MPGAGLGPGGEGWKDTKMDKSYPSLEGTQIYSEIVTQTEDYIVWCGKNNDGILPTLYKRTEERELSKASRNPDLGTMPQRTNQ